MKIKLDLHTHCMEATTYTKPTIDIVKKIVDQIKARGLDGIAITEHMDKDYAYRVKEIVEQHFDSQVIIIPGQEIYVWPVHMVELYLPGDVTFKFVGHPGYPTLTFEEAFPKVHGIEIENGIHDWHMDKGKLTELAEKHNLVPLSNSDAHNIEDIGRHFSVVDLEELSARAGAKIT